MSVADQWEMVCPKCGEDDEFTVAVTIMATLRSDGTDAEGDHEWDDESACQCGCGWEGRVHDAKTAYKLRVKDDDDQIAANGTKLCATCGNDFWGECPDQPRTDWRHEVANEETSLGYWEWAAARIEDAANS